MPSLVRPAASTSPKLAAGKRRNLTHEEEAAFWSWATVEILRHTGIFSAGHPLRRKLISAFAQFRG